MSGGVTSWDLAGYLLSVGCCDGELTRGAHFNLLVFSRVEDLEDVLAEVVAGAGLHRSALKQHLNISQLREIKVSFLIERVILKSHLLDRRFKFANFRAAGSTACTNTTSFGDSARAGSSLSGTSVARSSRTRWLSSASAGSWSATLRWGTDFTAAQNVVEILISTARKGVILVT